MVHMPQSAQKESDGLGILAETGWLADQAPEFRAWVAETGRWRRFAAGETLYVAGETPDGLYGLAHGTLELSFPLVGEEPVAIHRAEPGFWIGEAAILAKESRLVSVTAVSEALVLFLPAARIRTLLDADPRHWRALYDQSHRNLKTAVTLLSEALALTPRARLARLLLRIADRRGEVSGSQEELGRVIGMTRSSVRRTLSGLIEEGVIQSGYGRIVVVDRAALEALCAET